MRNAEEWATHCHTESHWIAWSAGQGGAEKILCINCARAYARECVEAWREKAAKMLEDQAIQHPLQDRTLSGIREMQGKLHAATALRALPGETP